jgi:DNA-binding FadR family transcriptional regulator
MDADPRFHRAVAESTRRSWFVPLIVMLLLVLANFWLASRERTGDPSISTTATTVVN